MSVARILESGGGSSVETVADAFASLDAWIHAGRTDEAAALLDRLYEDMDLLD